ncbi:methylated-DNA--[protein]-cysteine S-methyltransferase [Streptomyces sp. TRM 70351]|uniref:methylated-DNA--[protein]-cysteine S-methyltransferase n=1 Tax=Streptomyces sp. TRM 70351 TaxID=3116552 RepID=UPI002E7ABD2F|nr:methylated-DNA--[protein]-cysteine S-methyltransferase [Streptomyces sp. TRM 70351]MEE1926843.1 methylated-DNA--[protein]-cysteine S-methyltransferase [Streptomyces sp. TRM 70351]
MLYTLSPSPLGELLLAGPAPGTLAVLAAPGGAAVRRPEPDWTRDDAAFADAVRQLDGYFCGALRGFDLRLEPRGTAFRRRVWAALDRVPYGTTVSYAGLAELAGLPRGSARAVGGAVGANPLLVVRPCHRVVGAAGTLTGFAAGLEAKRRLLAVEGLAGAPPAR